MRSYCSVLSYAAKVTNQMFLLLNNERMRACYRLTIKTMRKFKNVEKFSCYLYPEVHPGLQSSLRPGKGGLDLLVSI